MRKITYSKTLLNLLTPFLNEKEEGSDYVFTKGFIYEKKSITATNRRVFVRVMLDDVPEGMEGSYDIDNNLITKEVEFTPSLFLMKPTTQKFVVDWDRWDKAYDTLKRYKRPKSYGDEISPMECVQLFEGLYVHVRQFNSIERLCRKYDITEFKYNDMFLIANKGQVTVALPNYENKPKYFKDDTQNNY